MIQENDSSSVSPDVTNSSIFRIYYYFFLLVGTGVSVALVDHWASHRMIGFIEIPFFFFSIVEAITVIAGWVLPILNVKDSVVAVRRAIFWIPVFLMVCTILQLVLAGMSSAA